MIEAVVPEWKPRTAQMGWGYASEQTVSCECRVGRVRWEYRVVRAGDGIVTAVDGAEDHPLAHKEIEGMLATLGIEEWELVAVQGDAQRSLYIFKRPGETG